MVANDRLEEQLLVPLKRPFTPVELGIKIVGIGKKGSKDLSSDLINAIVSDINNKTSHPISVGAFLAGLCHKGISEQEKRILRALKLDLPLKAEAILNFSSDKLPSSFPIAVLEKTLKGIHLSEKEAYQLGLFLLEDFKNPLLTKGLDFLKGFFVSYLRVRYESREEWLGLLGALDSMTLKMNLATEKKCLIFSEPFNGFKKQFFLSPIIGRFFLLKGFHPFHLMGRNSGPKFVLNLYDLVHEMAYPFFQGDMVKEMTPWGGFLKQKHLNPALDQWVEKRWLTIKRPCWATLEKFINPFPKSKSILITSAFHPTYLEKMVTLGEDFGYRGLAISKLGLEGGLMPSLRKPFKIIASKKLNGGYVRRSFIFQAKDIVPTKMLGEGIDKKFSISVVENKAILNNYLASKTTLNEELNERIKLAKYAYDEVLSWLEE